MYAFPSKRSIDVHVDCSGWKVSTSEVCPDGADECSSVIPLRCEPRTCSSVQPNIDKWSVNYKGKKEHLFFIRTN